MPYAANCPSCGAPVVFKSAVSFHAVCEFCRSTLVRRGEALENLGRMAELLDDASPIQLGTEGAYKGVHFAVIGRIQLKYAAGVWNEWHLLFDDQRSGWLSDAGGEYMVSHLTPPKGSIPDFGELVPDHRYDLAGREYAVSNIETALCIAGEGELPFAFGAGYEAPVADLRATDESGYFATIDYSESPPLFFVGESLPFAKLRFANLRGEAAPKKKAQGVKALSCPACGGAISVHDAAVQSIACPSCLTVLDAGNDSLKILQKAAAAQRIEPMLPLGSVGRFDGQEWTVIGFQVRTCKPVGFYGYWQEYLLHHPTEGFRWLVVDRAHWSWVTPMNKPPRYSDGLPTTLSEGMIYTRYGEGAAITTYVIGEFTWQVKVGEEWQTLDFIAPPRMLSREASDKEVTWSRGEYRSAEDIAAAFGLKRPLPKAGTVGAIQPNPHVEGAKQTTRRFLVFLLLAVVMQMFWAVSGGTKLAEEYLSLNPGSDAELVSKPFVLEGGARNLVVEQATNLSNNWIGMGLTLVEKKSGQAWPGSAELSYWSGYDDGAWSEGSREHELVFRDLPAGEYYFVVDPEFSDTNRAAVASHLTVKRNRSAWSNFFIVLGLLTSLWLLSRYRRQAFESARWADADFLSSGAERGSSDSDSDDGDSGGDDD